MSNATEKLQWDLEVMEQMASEMPDYLKSDVLFWPMEKGDMPRLTLGGYLLRAHRLTALEKMLDWAELRRLRVAEDQFDSAISGQIVRFEQRAHKELDARVRQWEQFLRDSKMDEISASYYATAVEPRAILEALLDKLSFAPYQLDPKAQERVRRFDQSLRNNWAPGNFVWSAPWAKAYPEDKYWWLYGSSR